MSQPWDDLKEAGLAGARAALEKIWDEEGVEEFVKAKLEAIAREKWMSINATTDQERAVHRDNGVDLLAHVRDEALRKLPRATRAAAGLVGDVAKALGGFLWGLAQDRLLRRSS